MNRPQFGESACEKTRRYMDAYLSNELLVETTHDLLQHFVDGIGNRIRIRVAPKEQLVRKPDCFLIGSFFRLWTGIHVPEIKRLLTSPA